MQEQMALIAMNQAAFVKGTRVRWLGANPDGWSGDGLGVVTAFEVARPYFHGYAPAQGNEAPRGPAVHVDIIGANGAKFDIIVAPDELEILPDQA